MRLTPTGEVEGRPEIVEGGGASGIERAMADSARRAVMRCAPYNLPAEKYETWADVTVNFDPTDMF
jgi:colicin import membrane protein